MIFSWITSSLLSDGEWMMRAMNTGLFETHGDSIGARWDSREWRPVSQRIITFFSRAISISFYDQPLFDTYSGWNVLGIESSVAWATPGQFTTAHNFPCGEGGAGCGGDEEDANGPHRTQYYVDPSNDVAAVQRKLRDGSHVAI